MNKCNQGLFCEITFFSCFLYFPRFRIKLLEDENLELRTKCLDPTLSSKDPLSTNIHPLQSELVQLREQNFELNRQKHQLSVHVEIVAAENRQLWSRLSNLTKTKNDEAKEPLSPTSHQNLIRSKTFTQNNPNPKLREKFKQNEDPEDLVVDVARFAISDNSGSSEDSSEEFKKLTDELQELKLEMSRQNSALYATHERLKERKSMLVCKNCATNKKMSELPSTSTKSNGKPGETTEESSKNPDFVDIVLNTTENIDFLETKRKADALNQNDRICPMCGRIYAKGVVFEEFMEHVETHFLEGEDDLSLESINVDEPFGYQSNIIHQF